MGRTGPVALFRFAEETAEPGNLALKSVNLDPQSENLEHALEIDAGRRQFLDQSELLQIPVGVAASSAGSSIRLKETPSLVDA